jgi:hypothetical protein
MITNDLAREVCPGKPRQDTNRKTWKFTFRSATFAALSDFWAETRIRWRRRVDWCDNWFFITVSLIFGNSFLFQCNRRVEKKIELSTFRFIKIVAAFKIAAECLLSQSFSPKKMLQKPMKLDLSIKQFFEGKFYTKKPKRTRQKVEPLNEFFLLRGQP